MKHQGTFKENFYVVNFFATPLPDYSQIINQQASKETPNGMYIPE